MYSVLCLALFTKALATFPLSNIQLTTSSSTVSNRYIIEVDEGTSLSPSIARDALNTLYSNLAERTSATFIVEQEFTNPDVFFGASISSSNNHPLTLAQISTIPSVKSVHPVKVIPRPNPVDKIIPAGSNDASQPDTESTHIMTGVDKLHAQGITGTGIRIGMIDSGVDYNHPDLGKGFGKGKKIVGGHDFVGDGFNGSNTPIPSSDPLDQCDGHGTHVAGIIGADPGNAFNISGVAYMAELFAYRVFGCTGTTTNDIVIQALLRAYAEGMDIVTLSLGSSSDWSQDITSVVADRIARLGKIVTVAVGNDGNAGGFYSSAPSTGVEVISVASVENTVLPAHNATTSDPSHPTISYVSLNAIAINGSFPVYATSNDTTVVDDACNPLPASTPDLSKFLVIIRRGTCTFVTKLQNVADKGARVSLIYNNANSLISIAPGIFKSALISAVDGDFLVKQFVEGVNITVSFPQSGGAGIVSSPSGGLVSSFSSYGPTDDGFFKPSAAAPGGNIVSTFPQKLGSYAVLSGTSMATPFVAGSCALLLQTKGRSLDVARNARTRFETTAQSIPSNNSERLVQTLTQQGAGLINVFNAIHYETSVSPGELLLNDTAHFVRSHVITIRNNGSEPRLYKLSHLPAGTAVTMQPGSIFPSPSPIQLTSKFATVHFSRETVTIAPHGGVEVTVTFSPPRDIDQATFPVYSGFVQIQSVMGGEILHVAYQGVAAPLKKMTVLDTTDTFFHFTLPSILNSTGLVQLGPTNYTFVGADIPSVVYRLASGTPRLLFELVRANIRPQHKRGLVSDGTPVADHSESSIGVIAEMDFQPRNIDAATQDLGGFNTLPLTNATFANNTRIPNGEYQVLVRALKIFGNPDNAGDYERRLIPAVIGVQVAP